MDDVTAMEDTRFTNWSVLASGEGAGRIASLYFLKMKNEAIKDRVLLMNSNKADISNTLRELMKHATTDEERRFIENIKRSNVVKFGGEGAGNFFKQGENYARTDFENVIRRRIEALRTGAGDVILEMAALGGGTGNGSIPYIIDQIKHGRSVSLTKHVHVALGIWPHYNEGEQRHFNAICGLSRLLKFGEQNRQNADMVILVDNSHLSSKIKMKGLATFDDFLEINKRIIQAIDLIIAPGRLTYGVIDIKDYVVLPSRMGLYHFAPCISLNNDISYISLELALDDAVENSFVPLDPTTAIHAYLVVRASQKYIENKELTEEKVNEVFSEWLSRNNFIAKLKMTSLAYVEDKTKDDFDVLLLLGGFDLDKLLEKSWKKYKEFRYILETASDGKILSLEEDAVLTIDELNRIENNLKEYLEHNRKIINKFRSG